VKRAVEAVCAALFCAVFAAFIAKIVMRYGAGDALAWADEVAVVLFVWIIFLANGFVVEDRRQICFDLVLRALPPRGVRVAVVLRVLLIGGLFAAALPGAIDYTLFLWRERTPVLGWRLDIVYACFPLFMIAVLVRLACQMWTACRRG